MRSARRGADAILHYGSKRTSKLALELDVHDAGHVYTYQAHLGFAAGDKLQFDREALHFRTSVSAKPDVYEL